MPNLLSNKINRSELQPADHIYSYRTGHIYSHQGIYIHEENKVIHFTRTEEEKFNSKLNTSAGTSKSEYSNSKTSNPNVSCCQKCHFQPNKQRGVVKTCIDCFSKGHNLYRYEYGVSQTHVCLKRPGTCSTSACDPPEKVIQRAKHMLHTQGFGDYSLSQNNCESFAIYCKTGKRVCGAQADSYMLSMFQNLTRLSAKVHKLIPNSSNFWKQ